MSLPSQNERDRRRTAQHRTEKIVRFEKKYVDISVRKAHIAAVRQIGEWQSVAGWSSLVARRAHNPKVIGSNPVPATFSLGAFIAGWSSLVARRAHNPKVIGSNPVPAIIKPLCIA